MPERPEVTASGGQLASAENQIVAATSPFLRPARGPWNHTPYTPPDASSLVGIWSVYNGGFV